MQGISGIILMIIIACLLPYVFTLIAKAKGGFQDIKHFFLILRLHNLTLKQYEKTELLHKENI